MIADQEQSQPLRAEILGIEGLERLAAELGTRGPGERPAVMGVVVRGTEVRFRL